MPELTTEERRRIYEEEKARLEGERIAVTRKPAPLSKKVALITICAVFALGAIFTAGYHQMQIHELKQRLGEAIGKDLGLTETILKVESESSKITFGEVFELCNKSVENRTNLIVELRGLYPEMDYDLKTRLVEYLSAENEFVRAKRDFYRKEMEQSSAATSYTELLNDHPSSPYGWDFFRDRVRQSKTKVQEAAHAAAQSADEFLKLYEKMASSETAIANAAHAAGLRFDPIFQKHATGNRKRAEDTKREAQSIAAILVTQKL